MDMQLHEHSHGGHGHSSYAGLTGRSDYDPGDPYAARRAMVEMAQKMHSADGAAGNIMEYAAALSPRGSVGRRDHSAPLLSPLDVPSNFFAEGSEADGSFSARAEQAARDHQDQDDPLAMSLNSLDSLFGRGQRADSGRGGVGVGPTLLGGSGAWGYVRGSLSRESSLNIEDYDEPLSLLSSRATSTGSQMAVDTGNGNGYREAGDLGESPSMAAYLDPLLYSLSSRTSDPAFTYSDDEGAAPSPRGNGSSSSAPAPGSRGSPRAAATATFKPPQLRLDVPGMPVTRRKGAAPPISFKDPSPTNAYASSIAKGGGRGYGTRAFAAAAGAGAGAEEDSNGDMPDWMLSKVLLETLQQPTPNANAPQEYAREVLQHNTPRSPGNQQAKRTRRHSPRGI